ncbi:MULTISPECIES: hypothetical protein [unclassified Brevibacterium]|jgi:hypothetical protein|uniref:hypothetical protein n=1 Tax=unclassified Brevibacterium TaxID=2614124 RepID=UPI001081E460|nr:hypothetical protein [Brevibacterium sp. S111]TGD12481.1 hypothetical protein EB836_05265 [Brevibacterium sp. S111]
MCDNSVIPSFNPSEDWYADWPHGVSTSVQILASVTGAAATRAVQHFLEPLTHNPDARVPAGVDLYYQGGFTVETMPTDDAGALQIVLASAGEDGFDSVLSAADDLTAALRETSGEVRLTWHELAATRAP